MGYPRSGRELKCWQRLKALIKLIAKNDKKGKRYAVKQQMCWHIHRSGTYKHFLDCSVSAPLVFLHGLSSATQLYMHHLFFWNPWPCDQSWLYHSSPSVIKTFDMLPLVQWAQFSRHSLCCACNLCVRHMLSSYRDGSCWPIGGLLCWVPVQPQDVLSGGNRVPPLSY